ncbi:MAG: glycerophosphoryl diester phosphodiesterase [Thermomicrobiales bacterium]|jgi:glycerophosphoryl diester phosphodiesterase|nr:glycerophosphoryl diester phosphodiesterase [Thermomicrobiales bacterium]
MTARDRPRIEVIGHGGAGDFFPGNSRESIEQALKIGVDRIEIDVQRSADGDLVLVHDKASTIHGRKIPADEITTSQFRRMLPGLLTLDELVEINSANVPLLLDVKLPGYEAEIIAAIRQHRLADTVAASSTHGVVLRRLKRAFPEMRLGLSTGHMATGIAARPARAVMTNLLRLVTPPPLVSAMRVFGASETMIQHRVCTDRLVRAVHDSGRRVNVWTVDRPEQMRRFIAMGVDGIISNRPDLVREAREESRTVTRHPD